MSKWLRTSETPGDGESIWLAVLEWDGTNTHVEYAIAFYDVDGVIVSRSERDKGTEQYQKWPPPDVLFWMPCDVPEFIAACPFCGTPLATTRFESCCASMIVCREMAKLA